MNTPTPYAYLLDPDLPAIRKRALKALSSDFAAVLGPTRYVVANGQKTLWLRKGWFLTSYVQIQKSDTGGGCYINIGYERAFHSGAVPSGNPGTQLRLTQLTNDPEIADHSGRHRYHLLEGESPMRTALVGLLTQRGIPLLDRIHKPGTYSAATDEFRPWLKTTKQPNA